MATGILNSGITTRTSRYETCREGSFEEAQVASRGRNAIISELVANRSTTHNNAGWEDIPLIPLLHYPGYQLNSNG